ncbi:hypothetical protein [Bacillus pinisoli]|uniref:hypothetical protein n=1 Tax=Bacillus pinisoli TaxID=2901866 RepID=UPI001FF2E846|nr:hypothetical protein [Bacillus pinisoli]
MKEKVYIPATTGILGLMLTVYGLVMCAGTIINIMNQDGLSSWLSLIAFSGLYLGTCAILFFTIKGQKIIITNEGLALKQLGMIRYQVRFEEIVKISKGKMSGSPIMNLDVNMKGISKTLPFPFLPFQKDWEEILGTIEAQCGKHVMGEMELKREPGELRTWANS